MTGWAAATWTSTVARRTWVVAPITKPGPLETAAKTALYGASYAIRLDSPPEDTHPAHGKVYRAYWGRLTATVRGSVTPSSDCMSKS
eukprot:COSAG03_NODE_16_length_21807_cov_27.080247_9_plen_87_part_00